MTEFRTGQRVKFEDPHGSILESERGLSPRGRITYIDGELLQVVQDGKAFAVWLDLRKTEVLPE